MEKRCLRCNATFSKKNKNVHYKTFTYLESESDRYIKETYNNCICEKCEKEINTNYYSFGVNPKYLKQTK